MKIYPYRILRGRTFFVLFVTALSLIGVSSAIGQPPRLDRGKIERVWVEPGTIRGLLTLEKVPPAIHVTFNVVDSGGPCLLQASFYGENGTAITAPSFSSYKSDDGHLAVIKPIALAPTPSYPPTSTYPNMSLPIPIRELSSKENRAAKIKFLVTLRCHGKEFSKSDYVALPFALINTP